MYWICIICGCLTGGKAEAGCGGGGSREMQILGGSEMQADGFTWLGLLFIALSKHDLILGLDLDLIILEAWMCVIIYE
jgi:hypothetical protein